MLRDCGISWVSLLIFLVLNLNCFHIQHMSCSSYEMLKSFLWENKTKIFQKIGSYFIMKRSRIAGSDVHCHEFFSDLGFSFFQNGHIVHKQSGKCLQLMTDTYRLSLEPCADDSSQRWKFNPLKF